MIRSSAYTAVAIFTVYALLRGDYHLANFLFERVCANTTELGVRVYEQEEIDPTFVTPVEDQTSSNYMKTFLTLSDDWMLNEQAITALYTIEFMRKNELHSIGPVYELVSSITRKSDGVILSKAVSVRSGAGWLSNTLTSGNDIRRCLRAAAGEPGHTLGRTSEHSTLARSTFVLLTN